MALSDRERRMLDYERSWWTESGPKDVGIAEKFDMTPDEYYGELGKVILLSDAVAYDPLVVRRMQRMRDRRRQARAAAAARANS